MKVLQFTLIQTGLSVRWMKTYQVLPVTKDCRWMWISIVSLCVKERQNRRSVTRQKLTPYCFGSCIHNQMETEIWIFVRFSGEIKLCFWNWSPWITFNDGSCIVTSFFFSFFFHCDFQGYLFAVQHELSPLWYC